MPDILPKPGDASAPGAAGLDFAAEFDAVALDAGGDVGVLGLAEGLAELGMHGAASVLIAVWLTAIRVG
jgi:hypothetical protein